MNHDVFISYSSQDKEAAQAICHVMEQNGIRCWMAPRDIPGGSQYGDVIDDAIKSCIIVVVLFSEPAAASPWVNGELNVAFEEQKTIIPFRLDQTPLKGQSRVMLNQKHWIDAYPDYETKFNDLVNAVTISLGRTNDVTTVKEEVDPKRNRIHHKWVIPLFAALFLVTCIVIWLFFKPKGQMNEFNYDREDIHVTTNKLSLDQISVLTEILDNMVLIEGGSFFMGLSGNDSMYLTDNDKLSLPLHEVSLSSYYISRYELTQKQWQMLCDAGEVSLNLGANKPVDYLSWQAAIEYVDTLSSITGLSFSLPTEAQWEYAARGGQQGNGYIFSGSDSFSEVGWLHDADASIHEIGKKKANELGLFDLTGNVQELCLDYFSNYTGYSETNPTGPSIGKTVVARGGSFLTSPFDSKNSSRNRCEPSFNSRATGMRLVINLN